jgi:hypothetical protein
MLESHSDEITNKDLDRVGGTKGKTREEEEMQPTPYSKTADDDDV